MRARCLLCLIVILGMAGTLISQPADKLQSGPQPGSPLPGSFAPLNINGEGKDRPRCLITHYEHDPVVMVFAREPAEGKDGPLMELMKKLDDAIATHKEDELRAFVVVLSPEARSSTSDPTEQDQDKLVEEAMAREGLVIRLQARAKDLKNVVLACYHESPKGYKLNDKAEVTVIYYRRQIVEANHAFAEGEMKGADVDRIIADVAKRLKSMRKE
jgi:hypothetical protein